MYRHMEDFFLIQIRLLRDKIMSDLENTVDGINSRLDRKLIDLEDTAVKVEQNETREKTKNKKYIHRILAVVTT